jgi:putative ABC transport system ATP-binding protein
MTAPPFIQVNALRRHYTMGQEKVRALDGIDVCIEQGEFLAVIGPSGSGKSTLLYLLGGLDRPTSGEIRIQGQNLVEMDEDELARFRQRRVGFVFQSFNLIPSMTALENVEFPLVFTPARPAARRERAKQLLEEVGLGDRLYHRPTELSGGQQQRVSIARSLVNDPAIVLADEPTGNLDSKSGIEVIAMLHRLNQEQGRTVILVTHDRSLLDMVSRTIQLFDGRLAPEEIVKHA